MINKEYLYAPFPVLDLNDILLRELTKLDAKDYFNSMSKPEMAVYITDSNRPNSLEEARDEVRYWSSLYKNHRSFYWGIALKGDNKLISTVGFNIINLEHRRAEISYDLDPSFWGQGKMLKSIKNILKIADYMGIIRIQATVITDNIRSINLLERCGFACEGVLKKYEIVANEHRLLYVCNTNVVSNLEDFVAWVGKLTVQQSHEMTPKFWISAFAGMTLNNFLELCNLI